jgi:two-component system, cell cycle response regulator
MKLLLVGDDPRDALAIREAITETGEADDRLEHAQGLARALDRIRTEPPDVLLLPLGPEGDGLAPLVQVRRRAPEVPVVVLVRPGDDELAQLALKEGAHDWLVRARIDGAVLRRSVRYAMERAHLSTELARAREQLNNLSLRDELTGLYNRRGFSVLAEQQMRLARRWDTGLLVLVLDVDGLESINDRLGRAAGDRVLAETGQLIRESFRDSDVKARVGGDEFVVLMNGAADGTCEVVDQRLTQNIERLNAQSDRPCPVSLSGGVAKWDPASGQTVADVLDTAEHLMHEQKRGIAGQIGCGGAS